MQRHLGGDVGQALRREVGRADVGLDRAEGVIDGLTPSPDCVGIASVNMPSLDFKERVATAQP